MTTELKNLDGTEKYAEPNAPLDYEPYRQTYELPDWKDGERLLKRTPPRDYGTGRLEDTNICYDARVMEREYEKVWAKTWLLAGHVNDIPRKNCFIKFDAGPVIGQDVVLVPRVQRRMRSRGYDGAILSEQEIRIRDFYHEYDRRMKAD